MQKQCYAFASRSISKSVSAPWGSFRGGGCSSNANRALGTSTTKLEALSKQEKSFTSIAGSLPHREFGGLSFRESADEFRVVFVLGGPGAGKGTQSDLLLREYPCVHLSAGQLLRDETTKENSPHAALIEECLVAGKIVPVGISLALLRKAMEENEGKSVVFLVDGFPRNFDNLEGWAKCMRNVANVWGILVYQCPLSVLEARIMERAKDSGRSDDNLESLRKRFKTFELDTMPIIDTLRLLQENSSMKVFDIIGDQTLENVWGETQDCMNSLIANDVLAANQQLLEAVATENSELYRSLSAGEMFEGKSSEEVMYAQEGRNEFPAVSVLDAKLTFMSGKKVSVTYKRLSKTTTFKETRLWSYKTKSGWRTIHYSRSPC